jgi:hypothetical protein
MKLFLCRGCGRHVKERTSTCPFCGAVVSTTLCFDSARKAPHVSRGVLVAGVGASIVAAVSCGGAYGQCPIMVDLESPCGFSLIETTCSGGLPQCTTSSGGVSCTLIRPDARCLIAVQLGDGTQHTVTVTVDGCVSPGFVSFASPTCTLPPKPPPTCEAGLDAADDAADANEVGAD